MNANTTVQVKTPLGLTEMASTAENMAQGSKSAGIICSFSLSQGMETHFEDSQYEISYGRVRLSGLLFQDDSFNMYSSIEGVRDGLLRFQRMMESKRLQINIDKSSVILSGRRNMVNKIRKEIEDNPFKYDNSTMKEKSEVKWLGDIIHSEGNKASSLASIKDRKTRIMNAMYETVAIIEDSRVNKMGSGRFAKDLWENVLIPAILNNSCLWKILDKDVQNELEALQSLYFRLLLAIPKTVPKPAICYEANLLQMKYRVFIRHLNFIKFVFHQEESVLSKQILEEQLSNEWPGPAIEAKKVEELIGVTGLLDPNITKSEYKKIVKQSCEEANDEDLKQDILKYTKMKALRDEVEKGNGYFFKESLENIRTIFRFRIELFEAKENFKAKYKDDDMLCNSCKSKIDENIHVLFCDSYKSLRNGLQLNNDSHLAWYLQKVLEIRTNLNLDR